MVSQALLSEVFLQSKLLKLLNFYFMKKLFLAILSLSLAFTACKKTDKNNNNNNNNNNQAPAPQPTFGSGDGGLVAVRTITSTSVAGFDVKTELGMATAVFGDLSNRNYVNGGDVDLNTKVLTFSANNVYMFSPTQADPTGIDFSSGNIVWNVSGNNGNGVPSFTYDASSQGMPTSADLDIPASIDANNDYTLKVKGNISNSDSVYFQIVGTNGTVLLKRLAGNTNSATFTSAELKTLGTGTGSMSICPWNVDSKSFGGKKIYCVNELALSSLIEIK